MASIAALLLALLLTSVGAQFGMDQLPKKPKPAPLKDDLKYIKCEVCKKVVMEASRQAASLSTQSAVEDMVERMCDADADGKEGRGSEGVWMSELDISKKGQGLVITNKGPGVCRRECRTVAKACEDIVERLEIEEWADLLRREKASAGSIGQRVCTKKISVCKKGKVPLWPEGKVRKDEQFKPRDKKDVELEELMASLNMQGMPGGAGLTMMKPSDMDLGDDGVDEIDVLRDEL